MPLWAILTIVITSIVFIMVTVFMVLVHPSIGGAFERSKQVTSVEHVIMMGQCMDRYIQDHPWIGCPRVRSIIELQRVLDKAGINCDEKFIRDGWGNLLEYEADSSSMNRLFSITSYGSDGMPGPRVYPNWHGEYIVRKFEEDIIYSSGRLVQHPAGASTVKY